MQSLQSYDIHNAVKDVIKTQVMVVSPEWQKIPSILAKSHETLKFRRAPMSDILTVLEAVYLSFRDKVNSHMFDWDSAEIMKFGTVLARINAYLELAGDELYKFENEEACASNLWPVFALIKGAWNDLFSMGCIKDD